MFAVVSDVGMDEPTRNYSTRHASPLFACPLLLCMYAMMTGKPFGVMGFGSTSYPRFCAAADIMHSAMLSAGATALLPPGKADAVAGEEGVLWPWLQELVQRMLDKGWLSSSAAAGVMEHIPASSMDKVGAMFESPCCVSH